MKKMNIPFSPPDITEKEIENVVDALKSGWITTGPKTKQLEAKVAQYCGTEKAATVNSATAAMEMTLRALGVGPGDEVITTAYTYTASASVVAHVGAKLILVDVKPGTFQIDFDQVEAALTEKTKVVIPVDIAGKMVDYDTLFEKLEAKKALYHPKKGTLQEAFDRVIVMADAAHSLGATYKGKRSGAVADFTCFSFHAVKNLTTAEGGAATWKSRPGIDNEALYKTYMLLTLHGQNKDALSKMQLGAWEYDIVAPYYKANMTDVHAAIGLAQFERYEDMLLRRRTIIERYDEAFKDLGITSLTHFDELGNSSGHLYLMRIAGFGVEERNAFIMKLAEVGIATNVHYKPLPMMTGYRKLGFDIKDYPNAYATYVNEVTLPLHTLLTDEEVDYIIDQVKQALK